MESLHSTERDGRFFYCFIEVCQALFPSVPKSTVRNWLKGLKIPIESCSPEERTVFKMHNPALGGTFGLIERAGVLRLQSYSLNIKSRCRFARTTRVECGGTVESTSTCCKAPTKASQEKEKQDNKELHPLGLGFSSDCESVPLTEDGELVNAADNPRVIVPYDNSLEEEIAITSPPPQEKEKQDRRKRSKIAEEIPMTPKKRKGSYRLPLDEAPESLRKELNEMRRFYMKDLNPLRPSAPRSKNTVEKAEERVLCFMFWCKNVMRVSELRLSLFNNVELYTSYLEYLRDVRKLKASTLVAHLIVCISVVKYNFAISEPDAIASGSVALNAYHGFQRQFQRESDVLTKCRKEGLLPQSKTTGQFYFSHILQTLRGVRERYFESKGIEKARHLHDFVLFATYLRAMPGRSKEFRTLRLHVEEDCGGSLNYETLKSGNFIVFQQNESIVICQFDFKNAKTLGPIRIDLSEDKELAYYLRLYLNSRQSLLLAKAHDFFFLNLHGEPFKGSAAFSKYLGGIFEREVSIRASTNAMRHAIVTYFCSLDEAKDHDVRKSLALLMKHSVRYQELVYNDQSHQEKTSKGREIIRKKIAADVFGHVDEKIDQNQSNDSDSDDDEKSDLGNEMYEILPAAGDIVALLDPVSTEKDIEFFLAKVARFSKDKKEVHLLHFEAIEDGVNMYRIKPGKVWTESVRALIYPIDVVYNTSQKAYELRTLPEDIYHSVHGSAKKRDFVA